VFNVALNNIIGHFGDELPRQSLVWCKRMAFLNNHLAATSKTNVTTIKSRGTDTKVQNPFLKTFGKIKLKICNTNLLFCMTDIHYNKYFYTSKFALMRHCLRRRAEYFNVKISELLQKNCFSTFVHAPLVASATIGLLLLILQSHRRNNYRA